MSNELGGGKPAKVDGLNTLERKACDKKRD
jgi:hypothetical protein